MKLTQNGGEVNVRRCSFSGRLYSGLYGNQPSDCAVDSTQGTRLRGVSFSQLVSTILARRGLFFPLAAFICGVWPASVGFLLIVC